MRRLGLLLLGCLPVSIVWAQVAAHDGRQGAVLDQRVARHQAEVQRLQQDVGRQESASQQAAQRLQEQDRAIAELRKQLKDIREAPTPPPAGH